MNATRRILWNSALGAWVILGSVPHAEAADCNAGSSAALAACVAGAASGDSITLTANITLASNLPVLDRNLVIHGGGFTLDGASTFRGFFVGAGSLAVNDLTMQNLRAQGGAGSSSSAGGGGGMGAGGAVFVRSGASVTLRNVALVSNAAVGGAGGIPVSGDRGGGGGGMGGPGGPNTGDFNVGLGGGGLFDAGQGGPGNNAGGAGGGPAGGAGGTPGIGAGAGGDYSGAGGSGYLPGGRPGTGASGGFGGGGGGQGNSYCVPSNIGGVGGYGGGGGGGVCGRGGDGGFGGGGAGSSGTRPYGAAGIAGGRGGFGGGNGSRGRAFAGGGGGGGAGMGGAIFVMEGASLRVTGSLLIDGNSVTAGSAGATPALTGSTPGSAFGAGIFFAGNGVIQFAPDLGQVQTIANVITDQTGSGGTGANAASMGLFVDGAGTTVLTGANTYTGGTTIAAGSLQLGDGGSSGSIAGNVVDNGRLVFHRSDDTRFAQVVSGTGQLVKQGNGVLTLSGVHTFTGQTTVSAGTLALAGSGSLAASSQVDVAAGAALDISATTAGATLQNLSGAGRVGLGAQGLTLGAASGVFSGAIDGSGGLTVRAADVFTLAGPSTYTGGTQLKAGQLNLAHAAALGSGALAMDNGTSLGFAADRLALANPIRFTGGADPGIDTGSFTATLSGGITGAGELTKTGSGTLVLAAANNTYTGATRVDQGTLQAGAANALNAQSAHSVAPGATLDTGGFNQAVAGLVNAGTVSLLGAAPGSTLTVKGNYVGNNGLLKLGTTLDNSNSLSDLLLIDGGSASGSTTVQVTNFGGLGALTTGNGIALVGTANGGSIGANAFTLAGGHVDAGAYEYRLNSSASGLSLSSSVVAAPAVVALPGLPASSAALPNLPANSAAPAFNLPLYRAEVPLLAALPEQLRQAGLGMLGNLHQRIGDDDVKTGGRSSGSASSQVGSGERRAWGRLIGTDLNVRQRGTVDPTSDGRLAGFQVGTDLLAMPNWRAGVYVGKLDGTMNVRGFARGVYDLGVGGNDLHGKYFGAYGTYAGEGGFHADAVLQFARHRWSLSPAGGFAADGKGRAVQASIEVGQGFDLGGGWEIEPQVQLVRQNQSLDEMTLAGATRVQQHANNGWWGRAGLRVKGRLGQLQPYARVNVYRASAGTDIATFIGPAASTTIRTQTGHTSTELAAGATLALTQAASLYGEVGKLWASGGDARVKGQLQGSLGVRVRW